jgi:hypothetical protein
MSTYRVQIVSIYATHRRHTGTAALSIVGGLDENAHERPDDFRKLFSDQVPYLINSRGPDRRDLRFAAEDGRYEEIPEVLSARLEIYALPFPADQVVAALILDVDSPDMNEDPTLTARLLRLCADARARVHDIDLAVYIDSLAANPSSEAMSPEPPDVTLALPLERHQLVLIGDLRGAEPPEEDVVKHLIYRVRPPYQEQFTRLKKPGGLNQTASTFGAVSPAISLLYGHSDDVENSVFLTTIQAVGTASRFQQIWQEAYRQVRKFQVERQATVAGRQQRKDLETLADEMGNLELDLAFSVETAADLGLRIPSSQIDSFHEDLYEVMQIRTRANTVSQMFIRLGGSIRSELTAIESRESQQEDARRVRTEQQRVRTAVAFGALSFVIAPIGFLLGFFGINARQVRQDDSIWNLHHYALAYVVAGLLALTPPVLLMFLNGAAAIRRALHARV